ncbi:fibrillarin-like rRNA/tRNA 2'-O-methyltransferase [Candidatus Bathyarchaeota archaeon]|nr:fibrillarin-like rRNA/tRNA 2'-O-methyltransferase [Candidatus Bathyarchaeota archaeon]NIR12935.1 fibrillarin-like rRNA/tRNA 2'-O-methyltransferase [Desulfobacterales bacterium]NIU81124.1 fibrillarin-like rRNA/tRNA 2'-O-methyltransferase [Candidatus Bathyarchaeota archaeon]NIV67852.1 fibrillarin-like rRNA/tRNA 2'-O-methyltransferase [Candidatus Bathyarchaeota archaeon]NIW16259.1 fibrillarin-like rRNA/tRNA 2'-O-methyltransferase [Candidatus Bathyarchaeota archaeon]
MAAEVKAHSRFPGIYQIFLKDGSRRLATKNLAPGRTVYGERLIKHKGMEYRIWDPFRSKFAAAILKDLQTVPIQPQDTVLYLGAASGTTASHVSDLVEEKGHVYCVEFAPRSIRQLVNNVCAFRPNMSPIMADARRPEGYSALVTETDNIYCDVAQPQQAKILADNADLFLTEKGQIMLAIKARSIDVTQEASTVYKQETDILEARGFRILESIQLEPYDKAHAMIVAQKHSK